MCQHQVAQVDCHQLSASCGSGRLSKRICFRALHTSRLILLSIQSVAKLAGRPAVFSCPARELVADTNVGHLSHEWWTRVAQMLRHVSHEFRKGRTRVAALRARGLAAKTGLWQHAYKEHHHDKRPIEHPIKQGMGMERKERVRVLGQGLWLLSHLQAVC
jgi:hypothetical protein